MHNLKSNGYVHARSFEIFQHETVVIAAGLYLVLLLYILMEKKHFIVGGAYSKFVLHNLTSSPSCINHLRLSEMLWSIRTPLLCRPHSDVVVTLEENLGWRCCVSLPLPLVLSPETGPLLVGASCSVRTFSRNVSAPHSCTFRGTAAPWGVKKSWMQPVVTVVLMDCWSTSLKFSIVFPCKLFLLSSGVQFLFTISIYHDLLKLLTFQCLEP